MGYSRAIKLDINSVNSLYSALSKGKLKQFVEGALQGSNGTTPPTIKVRNADSGDLNVRVSNYQLFNL